MKCSIDQIFGHVGLVGEVDLRLDQRQRLDQLPPPSLGAVADQTLELAERLPALRRRLCRDQVGQALHRREIEPAVLEGAAGELAGFGRPAAFDLAERVEHRGNDRVAAVKLQLGRVLAGLAARRRKPEHQCFVDDLAGRRIAHARQRRAAAAPAPGR